MTFKKITTTIIITSEHNPTDRHKSKWRYLHVIRNKRATFSPEPMAAIFDLTIASLVAPWWTSTSVIPHVWRPTNSVQVSGSTGQVLDYRSQPLHLCRPASQNHCSLLWVILALACWITISLREPLWMCASRCPQPAANTSGLLSFVYVTTPCFHDFSQSLCCDTLWPQSPSTGRFTKEYSVCCQTNKAYFEWCAL